MESNNLDFIMNNICLHIMCLYHQCVLSIFNRVMNLHCMDSCYKFVLVNIPTA